MLVRMALLAYTTLHMNDETNTPEPTPTPPQPSPQPPLDPIRPPAPAPVAPQPATPPSPNVELNQIVSTDPNIQNGTAPEAPEPESGTIQKVGAGFMAIISGLLSWIIFPLAVVLVLHYFVFQAYHVLGTSMNPTLQQTDYLIISKVGYTEAMVGRLLHHNDLYLPKRGQIIVFHYPKDPTEISLNALSVNRATTW